MPAAQYLAALARAYARGWRVDFGADAAVGIPSQVRVRVRARARARASLIYVDRLQACTARVRGVVSRLSP